MNKLRSFIREHRNLSIAVGGIVALGLIACCLIAVLAGGGESAAPSGPPTDTAEQTRELAEPTTVSATEIESTQPPQPTDTPEPTSTPKPTLVATDTTAPTSTPASTDTPAPTDTPAATDTPEPTPAPTDTMAPTDTPAPTAVPPTSTPQTAGPVPVGTHLVGTDIQPGIYVGSAGDSMMTSCYWARLSALSGDMDAVIANDNAMGPFYVEVLATDRALETGCRLLPIEAVSPPDAPRTAFGPGIFVVGRDMAPGTYRGVAGDTVMESCYWARLSCVQGTMGCIIANDNATGQFFVQVGPGDFALEVACELEKAE